MVATLEGGVTTLVLGAARSGKSEVAERFAITLGVSVTYVATGAFSDAGGHTAGDSSWSARIAALRALRPAEWPTMELAQGAHLGAVLASIEGAALVDSIGTWVSGLSQIRMDDEIGALIDALEARRDAGLPTVMVSEEVGLGVYPSTPVGRRFRDTLGSVNRRVADVTDSVLLVVAGRILPLPPHPPWMGGQGR